MTATAEPGGTPGPAGLPIRVTLLGRFGVRLGAHAIPGSAWRRRKARHLVQLLALAPQHRLPRDRLADLLWPEFDGDAAVNNLHRTLHVTRQALTGLGEGAETALRLELRTGTVRLDAAGGVRTDVEAFESTARVALADPARLAEAVECYRGDLLPEEGEEPWLIERRQALRERWQALVLALARPLPAQGDSTVAVEALSRLLTLDPVHEAATVRLIELLVGTGDQQRARRRYLAYREALARLGEAGPPRPVRQRIEALLNRSLGGGGPTAPGGAAGHDRLAAGVPASGNLPFGLDRFIGRQAELAAMGQALDAARCVTLVGPGGVGKTRLALEYARAAGRRWSGGSWLIELAGVRDPAAVPATFAAALGVREEAGRAIEQVLAEAIRTGARLLVVDNCEHVLPAAARTLTLLLGAGPDLRVVATSREPLGVPGELVVPVAPLSLPGSGDAWAGAAADVAAVQAAESCQLFVERARRRDPTFSLSPRHAGAVAALCRALDGLPLAIELAAARLGAFSVQQLVERLGDGTGLVRGGTGVGPERHRSLSALVSWSFDTLGEAERLVLRRLAVFAGSFPLEAVERVAGGAGVPVAEVPWLLGRLVDRSLAARVTGDPPRYRLLETIRAFAAARLDEAGETALARERHLAWCLEAARAIDAGSRGPDDVEWLDRFDLTAPDFEAALAWAHATDSTGHSYLRLAGLLSWCWQVRGQYLRARQRLEEALAAAPDAPPFDRAWAVASLGAHALSLGDHRQAEQSSQAGHDQVCALGYPELARYALGNVGRAMALQGRFEEAERVLATVLAQQAASTNLWAVGLARYQLAQVLAERGALDRAAALLRDAVADARQSRMRMLLARSLTHLAWTELQLGETNRAREHALAAVAVLEEVHEPNMLVLALAVFGEVELAAGEVAAAEGAFRRSLETGRRIGVRRLVVRALMGLSRAAARRGHTAEAVACYDEAERLRVELGLPLTVANLGAAPADLERLRGELAISASAGLWPDR